MAARERAWPLDRVRLLGRYAEQKSWAWHNYADHAAEFSNPVPKEPIDFFEAAIVDHWPGRAIVLTPTFANVALRIG